jgi:hypothetical protein
MGNNFKQRLAIEKKNKERLLKVNGDLNDKSGIYFLVREDENGFKFCYVGQARRVISRLAQHMVGYTQHIDRSLKKHGLYAENNPHGWNVYHMNFEESLLDEKEQYYIKLYATHGYQCLNKTSGSQGQGKTQIAEYRPQKGYYDGLKQGRKQLAKELSHIIDKHLVISLKKENNKVSQKALSKFYDLLDVNNYKEVEHGESNRTENND